MSSGNPILEKSLLVKKMIAASTFGEIKNEVVKTARIIENLEELINSINL